ncbi:MAG: glycan-binding surface protein [Paludibacter sp.]|nr:glycan-binding surface protein [Paludibacter sp.]
MRHNINKFLYASFVACILIGGLLFTSCDKDEEDLTTVKLSVFGPSPALRGGELKFIGANLDKVTAVVLSPNIEISTFVSKTANELVITIPQNTAPGKVKLKTPQGDITTITPLTFSEPISIASVAPAAVKAGDTFTINGDYLNLIAQVIFSDGVVVESANFISQTRAKIEVKVPVEAQTGKVMISNGAEIPVLVYTASPLQVTLPAVTTVAPNPVKPGTEVQITGTNFQLVKSLVFSEEITVDNFTVNDAKTQITAVVPTHAKEGSIQLVAFSSVKVSAATPLSLVGPAVTSISPKPVKNGETITITGTNLDLVVGATFGGDVTGVILSQSATQLEVTVPLTATEGKVTLTTNSGKTAETEAITLVKPTISSIAPLALMAGNDITITGTHLDLVRKVTFVGGLSVDVTPASATSFTVTVPPAAVGTAAVVMTTTNGTEVTSSAQLAIEAANKPVITGINASVKPGAKLTITGTKLNLVEAIYFQPNVKAVLYGVRTETSIEVFVPETAKKGAVTLKLVAYNGDEVVSPVFNISGTDPITDPSLVIWNFDSGLAADGGSWSGVGGLGNPSDALSGAYYEIKASNWGTGYWWFAENWMDHPSVPKTGYVVKMDIRLRNDIPALNDEVRLMLGGKVVNILPYLKVGDAWTTGGDWKTITIPLSAWTDLADPTPVKGGEWGIATWINTSNFTGFCIDNIRYEKASALSGASRLY